jgi:meso-butanediol dehydrogenase / (S,S)-butanediol dehydrogenase / diacetyl reductase
MSALAGRRAIVTGGGSGIGEATVLAMATAGASVVALDRDLAAAQRVADGAGGASSAMACDVADPAAIERAVAEAADRMGGIDVAVSNVGIGFQGTIDTIDAEQWDTLFAVNVRSCFLLAKHTFPVMRSAGGGSFLVTASLGGLVPATGTLAYSATKAALINMCRTMALDHGRDGIRVNCVCPGAIETPTLGGQLAQAGLSVEGYGAMIPRGVIGQPADIADTYVFLASDAARHISGQAIAVDGGQHAGMFRPPPPPA